MKGIIEMNKEKNRFQVNIKESQRMREAKRCLRKHNIEVPRTTTLGNYMKQSNKICVYGVILNYDEMLNIMLYICEIAFEKEYRKGFSGVVGLDSEIKKEIYSTYILLKEKGEVYDFSDNRVLNIYSFFEYLGIMYNYTELEDLKVIDIQHKGESMVNFHRYHAGLYSMYDKLVDVTRKGKENELFVFGVNIGYVANNANLFLYQNDLRVLNNWKKYCVPVLKHFDKSRKPTNHYIELAERRFF